MKVKEIMKAPVHKVGLDMLTADVARLLVQRRISGVPVLDDTGAVVGLVSEHDLISRDGPTAADVMSPGIVSVTEDTEVDDVRHLLVDRRIRRVPVMSGGHLVGIVSRADIVALIAMEWVC
jgi:CBS domain-containing protein